MMKMHHFRIHNLITLVLLLTALITAISSFYIFNRDKQESFINNIKGCNSLSSNQKFSCYRKIIETSNLKAEDLKKNEQMFNHIFSEKTAGEDVEYAVFGTNCHTFYHALGDYIATNTKNEEISVKINKLPLSCTSGAMMGFYKRIALKNNYSTDILKSFYDYCPKGAEHQCAHEIGHVIHDKYTSSILKIVDGISNRDFNLPPTELYQYTTFPKANLDQPFEDCKSVLKEEELPYCYTGIGHNLFLFAEFEPDGYKTVFKECDGVAPSHKDDCYAFIIYRVGINIAAPQFLSAKIDEGIKTCDDTVKMVNRDDFKKDCYIGLGGGIGLYIDSEYNPSTEINDENLSRIQKDVSEKISLCDRSEEGFIEDCYKGILGTPVKKLYKKLNLEIQIINDILPKIQSDFEVVG